MRVWGLMRGDLALAFRVQGDCCVIVRSKGRLRRCLLRTIREHYNAVVLHDVLPGLIK
jgi:hypothetical protein